MEQILSTTPFGRRPLSLAMMRAQAATKEAPAEAAAHKWRVWRAIAEAKDLVGVSDRALAVLNALLSFHPETVLTSGAGLIVFPSNQELSLRSHGMAPATLRRHLASLVELGLVIRRDSPNGKRYARKGQGGEIEQAFGFDLSPLAARAAEFEQLASEVKAERAACASLRERISILRRDVAKWAEAAQEHASASLEGLLSRHASLCQVLPRNMGKAELKARVGELEILLQDVQDMLAEVTNLEKVSANESQTERHIQNSKPDPQESELASREVEAAVTSSPQPTAAKRPDGFSLGMVLDACPDVAMYARNGIKTWSDLVGTAGSVRSMLGVSSDAWLKACETMGETHAAIVIAAILQKGEQVTSAGGYLRVLTEKAREGQFSIGPVLMALWRKKHAPQQDGSTSPSGQAKAGRGGAWARAG